MVSCIGFLSRALTGCCTDISFSGSTLRSRRHNSIKKSLLAISTVAPAPETRITWPNRPETEEKKKSIKMICIDQKNCTSWWFIGINAQIQQKKSIDYYIIINIINSLTMNLLLYYYYYYYYSNQWLNSAKINWLNYY